jgi:hypothetical protein
VITGVRDGNTLEAEWRSIPQGFEHYQPEPELKLAGVWSDPDREPQEAYSRRVTFLKSLIGKTVIASTITASYPSKNPAKEYYLHLYIETPTEVFLNEKSVNEAILANGYAILDEGELNLITDEERNKFRAAEKVAQNGHKGIWADPTDVYSRQTTRMLEDRELALKQRQGASVLLKLQGIFVLMVLLLAYLVRRDPDASKAALVLLLIPVGMLMPAYVRFGVSFRSNPYAANSLLIAFSLLCVSVWIFMRLVTRGPAEHWGAAGIGIKRSLPLLIFFAGLTTIITIFTMVYEAVDHLGRPSALHESVSIALGLSVAPALSATMGALAQKTVLLILTGFCTASFSPQGSIRSRSITWNLLVAITLWLIVAIAAVSMFALCYSAAFEAGRMTDAVDIGHCLKLACFTLLRFSYSDPSIHVSGIWMLQTIEASLGLLLTLVGFRTIFWMVSPGARTVNVAPAR